MQKLFHYKPFGILRFALALLVLTQHFCNDIAPLAIKQAVFPWGPGNVAVLGFFMMSGFIICEAYHYNYQGRPFAYMQNRLMRIVPGYWAALAVSIAVHFALFRYDGHLIGPGHHVLGIHHFESKNILKNIFGVVPHVEINVSDTEYPFFPYVWALQTEMMFYLAVFGVGCAYPFLRRLKRWPQEYWLAMAGCLGLVVAAFSQIGMLPGRLVYGGYFAFGGALFYLLQGNRKALFILVPAFLQILWHFHNCDASDFVGMTPNRPGQLLLLSTFLIVFITLARTHIENTKIDKGFGEVSYSLYLNHFAATIFILNTADHFSVRYLIYGLVASLALAWLMQRLIERPLIGLRRSIRQNEPESANAVPETGDVILETETPALEAQNAVLETENVVFETENVAS